MSREWKCIGCVGLKYMGTYNKKVEYTVLLKTTLTAVMWIWWLLERSKLAITWF